MRVHRGGGGNWLTGSGSRRGSVRGNWCGRLRGRLRFRGRGRRSGCESRRGTGRGRRRRRALWHRRNARRRLWRECRGGRRRREICARVRLDGASSEHAPNVIRPHRFEALAEDARGTKALPSHRDGGAILVGDSRVAVAFTRTGALAGLLLSLAPQQPAHALVSGILLHRATHFERRGPRTLR